MTTGSYRACSSGTPTFRALRGLTRGTSGFTLTEFVFAVSIVGFALVGFSSAAGTATTNFRHFRAQAQAIAIADAITEEVLILDASDPELEEGRHIRYFDRTGAVSQRRGDRFYTAVWTITNYEDVPGIRKLDILVAWREGTHPESVSWTTYRN